MLRQRGLQSLLDQRQIDKSRDIGAAAVFNPVVDGRRLTFRAAGGGFFDAETGSRWTVLGRATAGPLTGRQLEPVIHGNHFWFAMAAFKPNVRIYSSP